MFYFKASPVSLCIVAASLLALIDSVKAEDPYQQSCLTTANVASYYDSNSANDAVLGQRVSDDPIGGDFFQEHQIADNPWFVRFGVGILLFGEGSSVRANGAVVPGAGVDVSDATTFAFDIGYQLSPVWSATFSGGVPAKLDLTGTGPFAGAPYGTTQFAPIALTLQRHFFVTQRTSIYVGGGINYNFQYETKDGLIQNLDIDNDAAAVLQLGVERRINDRISLFADAKKAFYRTQAFGNIGPTPIRSDITVNPTVLVFGVKYNF